MTSSRSATAALRQNYVLDIEQARLTARDWLSRWPVASHWTRVESWTELADGRIAFTMMRLQPFD